MESRRLSRAADFSHVGGIVMVDVAILLLWSLVPQVLRPLPDRSSLRICTPRLCMSVCLPVCSSPRLPACSTVCRRSDPDS
jgi:hypothetical protein